MCIDFLFSCGCGLLLSTSTSWVVCFCCVCCLGLVLVCVLVGFVMGGLLCCVLMEVDGWFLNGVLRAE